MNNFLKIFKYNFYMNRGLFFILNIMGLTASIIFFIFSSFSFKMNISSSIADYNIKGYSMLGTEVKFMSINIIALILIIAIYVILSIYKRIYNADGSMYVMLQLPVNKNNHLLSIFAESIIFTAVQYIFCILMIFATYKVACYFYNANISLFNGSYEADVLKNFKSYAAHLSLSFVEFDVLGSLYRMTITTIGLVSFTMFILINFYKFGKKAIVIFIIAGLLLIFIEMNYSISIIYHILICMIDSVNIQNLINSLVIIAVTFAYSSYFFSRRIDF